METPRQPDRCAPHPPLKPSLEGWKQLYDFQRRVFPRGLETFLRGMETNLLETVPLYGKVP